MNNYLYKEMLKWHEDEKARREARQKLIDVADTIHIPISYTPEGNPAILLKDFFDMNEDDVKKILSYFRLKAFW